MDPKTFRLLTYNILDGGLGREAAITSVIAAAEPDVVMLPEVTRVEVLAQMAQDLAMEYRIAGGGDRARKVGVLSKWPIWRMNTARPGWALRHLITVTVQLPGGRKISIGGVHLMAFYLWLFEKWREAELKSMLKYIQQVEPELDLLAGDFNAVVPGDGASFDECPGWVKAQVVFSRNKPPAFALNTVLDAGYVDCFRKANPQADGFTLPASNPDIRLDYVFARRSFAESLKRCEVVTAPEAVKTASDHLPVLAEFDL